MKQTFILGSPEYYKSEAGEVNTLRAKKQWNNLKSRLESNNINVEVVPGSKYLFDSVYITDSALIINDFAIMARYHKQSRQGEEILTAEYLKNSLNLRILYLPEEDGLYYEGGGDTRISHEGKHIWFGYGGGRSTLKGIEAVINILKKELGQLCPIPHKLRIDNRITFHLDLAFLPLPNGRILYYPTLSQSAIQEIKNVFGVKNTIKVPSKYFFACNSVWLDEKTLLSPSLPYDDYRQWMYKATQMKIIEVNLSEFHLGNGSVQCMILRMWKIPIANSS